jgi:hypothetical protein
MANATTEAEFRLGIDFGTSHTTAIVRWPDGHVRPLLFDGSPLLPSAVYADPDGRLLVGRDAIHAARLDPARFEPTPKRRIAKDDTTVRLGDQEISATAMVAAVLARVRDEAVRVTGVPVERLSVTLTHPAGWDSTRVATLSEASHRAGMAAPRLVPEPVAAAGYFVSVLGRAIPPGSVLVVYDFGGGTFDASVVAPNPHGGYDVLAVDGLDDVGGVDLDSALLRHVADAYRHLDPDAWQRLEEPRTPADRRHRRHLIEDVRAAKEMLSRAPSATIPVPLLELEARITRAEFDALAQPYLRRTVTTTTNVIGNTFPQVAAILLVGGSSRIPLVAELLRAGTGHTPAAIDQPETVVAEGSIRLADGGSGLTRAGSAIPIAPGAERTPGTQTTAGAARNPDRGAPADPWAAMAPIVATPQFAPIARPTAPTVAYPGGPVTGPTLAAPTQIPAPRLSVEPATVRQQIPVRPPGVPQPRRPETPIYLGRPRRRRWPAVVTVVVLLAGLGTAGVVYGLPYLDGQTAGPGTPTSGQPTATTRPAYVRMATPAWLPQGWTKIIDDETRASVVAGVATNGGTCQYQRPGVIQVTRDTFDVSGCVMTPETKQFVVRDGAIEAEFNVSAGCGGMWMRTGARGYFLAVCADGTVALHVLGDDPPSAATLKRSWPARQAPAVVGLLARGSELTVYVDGEPLEIVLDESIGSGRLGVGGFAPSPANKMDATISRFRAWTPTGTGS